MQSMRWDTGLRRPYIADKGQYAGQQCVTVNTGQWTVEKGQRVPLRKSHRIADLVNSGRIPLSMVANATALRKEEWIQLDTVVLRAARYRLRAWGDLASRNTFGGFSGMNKLLLEHETMSDPGEAVVDMDGLTEGRTDAPLFQLQGLPLPITHSDFWFSSRVLSVSRNSGTPLDVTLGEAAGRRVGEMIEKTTIGVTTGITYGGNSTQVGGYGRNSTVYGYINFTPRLTKTNISVPTGSNPSVTIREVLAMRDQLTLNKFYGPFMLYHSNQWDQYMDNDYTLTGGNVTTQTLRQRLKAIEGIEDVRRLDFLFDTAVDSNVASSGYRGPGGDQDAAIKPYRFIMVQMTPDVARAVVGMDLTTVQWESVGGMRLNFKVMTISVPQLRADYYSNCGILDATTS